MRDVDMVSIHAHGDGDITVEDLYSRGFYKPSYDETNNFIVVESELGEDGYSIIIERDFDTGDSMDTIMQYGGPREWQWAANSNSAQLSYHNSVGWFDSTLDPEDCILSEEE